VLSLFTSEGSGKGDNQLLFSVAGQVVTAKRVRLDPSTVTLLVFLHEAIPGGIEREAYEIIETALEIEHD